jgi:hypothetical protein
MRGWSSSAVVKGVATPVLPAADLGRRRSCAFRVGLATNPFTRSWLYLTCVGKCSRSLLVQRSEVRCLCLKETPLAICLFNTIKGWSQILLVHHCNDVYTIRCLM